ncbi:MAG: SEC-C metal-binding domain-containing protein [Chlamydiota bacterium]|nr:SEC-C metal-binding domain-containing protein [Chlamydiota bacterium]
MGSERNAPCPCGSGKKHKKCCAGKSPLPKRDIRPLDTKSHSLLRPIQVLSSTTPADN